jgi:hypothetical protein
VLDPAANEGARVWTTCPACGTQPPEGCYLLGYTVSAVFVQCPECLRRWYFDTGFGVGDDRSDSVDDWWRHAS